MIPYEHADPNRQQPGETLAHAMLRNEFEDLFNHNLITLNYFDPNGDAELVNIDLAHDAPEYEAIEPQTAAEMRQGMLNRLGLDYRPLEEQDKTRLFQHEYDGGLVEQMRRVTRADGTQVVLYTEIDAKQQSHIVRLVSNEHAPVLQRRLELNIAVQEFNKKLPHAGLGLDINELLQTDLTAADISAMARALEAIEKAPESLPGQERRDEARAALARITLPAHGIFDPSDDKKYNERYRAYLQSVNTAVNYLHAEGGQAAAKQFLADEQELRLAALNERLRLRVRVQNLGRKAMVLTTAFGGFFATGVGESMVTNTNNRVVDLIGAMAMGTLLGLHYVYKGLGRHRQIPTPAFSPQTTARQTAGLDTQIEAERERARRYRRILRKT
jgi:hypothetical protein